MLAMVGCVAMHNFTILSGKLATCATFIERKPPPADRIQRLLENLVLGVWAVPAARIFMFCGCTGGYAASAPTKRGIRKDEIPPDLPFQILMDIRVGHDIVRLPE